MQDEKFEKKYKKLKKKYKKLKKFAKEFKELEDIIEEDGYCSFASNAEDLLKEYKKFLKKL